MKTAVIVALLAFSAQAMAQVREASPTELEVIVAAVKARVKDPESVQLRDVRIGPGDAGMETVCGQVNARNSFGGYVGFSTFTGFLIPAVPDRPKLTAVVIGIDEHVPAAAKLCADRGM